SDSHAAPSPRTVGGVVVVWGEPDGEPIHREDAEALRAAGRSLPRYEGEAGGLHPPRDHVRRLQHAPAPDGPAGWRSLRPRVHRRADLAHELREPCLAVRRALAGPSDLLRDEHRGG